MTQPNLSLTLTKDERNILLEALTTKTIKTRGYFSSYDDVVNGHATISELTQKVEDASPGITLSVDQLSGWAGRTLQTEEVDRLAAALEHSSVPEAIATIMASFETPEQIAAEVLHEAHCELGRYEDNAENGTTVQDAATDVVQRLYDLYGVMPIPK